MFATFGRVGGLAKACCGGLPLRVRDVIDAQCDRDDGEIGLQGHADRVVVRAACARHDERLGVARQRYGPGVQQETAAQLLRPLAEVGDEWPDVGEETPGRS